MDVKEAASKAVDFINDLYQSEKIRHVGLEEVKFDDQTDEWVITIGFFRQWDKVQESKTLAEVSAESNFVIQPSDWKQRTFKTVRINNRTASMTMANREST